MDVPYAALAMLTPNRGVQLRQPPHNNAVYPSDVSRLIAVTTTTEQRLQSSNRLTLGLVISALPLAALLLSLQFRLIQLPPRLKCASS